MQNDQEKAQFLNVNMPIKVKPYEHQVRAFIFALQVLGFID